MRVERQDRVGLVAGGGGAGRAGRQRTRMQWRAPVSSRRAWGRGTATPALVPNGLGFSERRLDLASRRFAARPVGRSRGPGGPAGPRHATATARGGRPTGPRPGPPRRRSPALPARRGGASAGARASQGHADATSRSVRGATGPDPAADGPAGSGPVARPRAAPDLRRAARCRARLRLPQGPPPPGLPGLREATGKQPGRIAALALVMVARPPAYRPAEHRSPQPLAAAGQAAASRLERPTDRPTMRGLFRRRDGMRPVRLILPQGPPPGKSPAPSPSTSRSSGYWDQVVRSSTLRTQRVRLRNVGSCLGTVRFMWLPPRLRVGARRRAPSSPVPIHRAFAPPPVPCGTICR